ncbi:Copper ion transmembrane transporter [Hibiscus syriacus]|uniref:Copper ion transmembrane transporter n=1 Tax=Hibiscus syriacus TaxID=106335 RepID=A0A6A2WWP4_HIBSY|nr:Copper ion transmembrane transporter [Hibiscus syriacus]
MANAQTSDSADLQHPAALRKLGMHQIVKTIGNAPASSPSPAPRSGDRTAAITGPNNGENVSVEGEAIDLKKPHRSVDKSVAGGGVILGGLATTFLVAVFCYIKTTGRHESETRQSNNDETSN